MRHRNYLLMLLGIILCCNLTSCGTATGALVGNYDKQYSIETTLSYDRVWDEVIDFFAINSIPISTLEKNSGLIVSKGMYFDYTVITYEKRGTLVNPNAWVVLADYYPQYERGGAAIADFNVRVRQYGDRVRVTVNILNVKGSQVMLPGYGFEGRNFHLQGKSTGVLETMLLELFTKE